MKILFYLSHPSHYHVHKNTIRCLKRDGHLVYILIRKKDILEELLVAEGFPFVVIQKQKRGKTKLNLALDLVVREMKMLLYLLRNKVDLLAGSDASVSHMSGLLKIPSLIFAEDDVQIIPDLARIMYPHATMIISPEVCDTGKWSAKKIGYNGYQKLAYLHPSYFAPDRESISSLGFDFSKKNFLIRLSGLQAHHDTGIKGFNKVQIETIIRTLLPDGNVLISSEIPLPEEFKMYSFNFPPSVMHSVLFYSDLLICDSQSMAVEAAILGIPSLRFNDFAGRISVLEELENRYQLTFGFQTTRFGDLIDRMNELLAMDDIKSLFRKRKEKMLSEKIDVTDFFLWLIEEYPQSMDRLKADPALQYSFRE